MSDEKFRWVIEATDEDGETHGAVLDTPDALGNFIRVTAAPMIS